MVVVRPPAPRPVVVDYLPDAHGPRLHKRTGTSRRRIADVVIDEHTDPSEASHQLPSAHHPLSHPALRAEIETYAARLQLDLLA